MSYVDYRDILFAYVHAQVIFLGKDWVIHASKIRSIFLVFFSCNQLWKSKMIFGHATFHTDFEFFDALFLIVSKQRRMFWVFGFRGHEFDCSKSNLSDIFGVLACRTRVHFRPSLMAAYRLIFCDICGSQHALYWFISQIGAFLPLRPSIHESSVSHNRLVLS